MLAIRDSQGRQFAIADNAIIKFPWLASRVGDLRRLASDFAPQHAIILGYLLMLSPESETLQ
jgi:hypothetical protein